MTRIEPRRLPIGEARREAAARAREHLETGGLLVYPTETVYGLGAAANAEGIAAVRKLKGREESKPLLLLIGTELPRELVWSPSAQALAARFWPGPLTLVLPDPDGTFPPGVRSPEGGVAVRRSPHPFVRELLELLGGPLLSTSANLPGEPPPVTGDGAAAAFAGRPGSDRLLVMDGGDLPAAPPSTLVDCTQDGPRLLREGTIPRAQLLTVVPTLR